ncbi:HAD family hydrolase [Chloroflexota bacterium]
MNLPEFNKIPDAVAIDLDGTLLNTELQVSERNRMAIGKCIASGIPVVIATARAARSVHRVLGVKLASICSLVCTNGAVARAAPPLAGEIREEIPPAVVSDIIRSVLEIEPNVLILIELDGEEFGTNMPRDPEELWRINSATPDMQLSLEDALDGNPAKVLVDGLGRKLVAVAERISEKFCDFVAVVPSDEMTLLNIIGINASKPNALRKLLGSSQISLDNVVAFGDDIPDIEMLQQCGIPVAMANAIPEVKEICSYQTASNDDDGVAIVLEKILELVR